MNVRALLVLSVLLNVVLAVLGWRTSRGLAPATAEIVTKPTAAVAPRRVRTDLTRVEVTETNQAAPFHWRQVQAENLQEFTANLRGVGCPPETVRAIIESELWARFLARRRLLLEPFHRGYWDLLAVAPDKEKAIESIRESLKQLRAATVETLDELVGPTPLSQENYSRHEPLDFLPEPKQREFDDLEKRFSVEIGQVWAETDGTMTPEQQAKRQDLEAQRRAAIRALLAPEEYAEYELRQSRHASIAQSSIGFDGTPEDMRAIARIYQKFEAANASPDRKEPNAAAKKAQAAQAKNQRDEALRDALPPERYTQFQDGLDGRFQEVYRVTQRYEFPRETASEAAGVLRAREEALRRLREAKAPDRTDLLQRELAVQLETRKVLLGVLGERALLTYEKYQGPVIPVPNNDVPK